MQDMFTERDRLRGELWSAMLGYGSKREALLRRMVKEPSPKMVRLARRERSSRRDAPLAKLLHAQVQSSLRLIVRELLEEGAKRAPKTAAAIQRAWTPVDRIEGRLLTGNMALAMYHANRWRANGMDVEDLVQEAALGLQRAVCGFEVGRGFTFSTYATPWVVQAIQRSIHNQRATIRIPVHLQEVLRKLLKLQTEGMTLEESVHALGISMGKAESALVSPAMSTTSLDAPRMFSQIGGGFVSLHNLVPSPGESPEDAAVWDAHGEAVAEFVAGLDGRTRFILERRAAGDTLAEVGEELELSRERVRQLEAGALARIAAFRARAGWADAA